MSCTLSLAIYMVLMGLSFVVVLLYFLYLGALCVLIAYGSTYLCVTFSLVVLFVVVTLSFVFNFSSADFNIAGLSKKLLVFFFLM